MPAQYKQSDGRHSHFESLTSWSHSVYDSFTAKFVEEKEERERERGEEEEEKASEVRRRRRDDLKLTRGRKVEMESELSDLSEALSCKLLAHHSRGRLDNTNHLS